MSFEDQLLDPKYSELDSSKMGPRHPKITSKITPFSPISRNSRNSRKLSPSETSITKDMAILESFSRFIEHNGVFNCPKGYKPTLDQMKQYQKIEDLYQKFNTLT